MKNILQVGDIAGIPQLLADRTGGKVVVFKEHSFGYSSPNQIVMDFKYEQPISGMLRFIGVFKLAIDYDIIHFHWGTLLPCKFDLLIWKKIGIKTYLHYRGSEIRGKKWKHSLSFAKTADKIFVSTPDLLQYADGAEWVPNPVDLQKISFVGSRKIKKTVRILHAPSIREKKGTGTIERAVESVQAKGYSIEFICLTGVCHDIILEEMRKADIIIDQIRPDIGSFGNISLEAMATGKPVLCTISEFNDRYYGVCPIVPIRTGTVEEIEEKIVKLIDNPELRETLGSLGREYVEKNHDVDKIVARLYA